MKNRQMLDRWAANIGERRVIAEFWAWLEQNKPGFSLYDINVENCMDAYHGIDQKQLEKERRALFNQR